MTHSPRRLPSNMSEHPERRSAVPSLVHDRVLTDRPGDAGQGRCRRSACDRRRWRREASELPWSCMGSLGVRDVGWGDGAERL
jgi:hypothetical protein